MKFRGFKLFYENRDATDSMVRQCEEFPSFFTPADERPTIIDCGANIGVSMLEWKSRWPGARILCFEPDPFAFRILVKNVEANDIPGVSCINAALSDDEQQAVLFGDIAAGGDARGNSIDAAWGSRAGSVQAPVRCQRLSTHLAKHEVAFLKLDIEGAEQRVLAESAAQLHRVQAIYVEVHETAESRPRNSAAAIHAMLDAAGFTVEADARFAQHALPAHLHAWQAAVDANQTQLMGWR